MLNGTETYESGPIASITTVVQEEDEATALAREVMEEPRTVIPLTMTIQMRVPLRHFMVNVSTGRLVHPDGSSVEAILETDSLSPDAGPGVAGAAADTKHPRQTLGLTEKS